ncbi:MAG: hypothetical protein JWQ16_166 [Novosphingobium sp.]|nr:hypothetical protein [Novosphingobium sp.]
MPFLILDKNSEPLVDPATGLICHFDSRDDAEAYRKDNNGARVMEIPVIARRAGA